MSIGYLGVILGQNYFQFAVKSCLMLLRQGFLFKLKPNGRQARQMSRFAGCCRFVYNKGLSWAKEQYENKTGKHPSYLR